MAKTGPAPLIDEREFVPADLEQARQLYTALVRSGSPVSQARGIVAWLITLTDRRADDPSSDVQRSRYRQVLNRLGEPPWRGGRPYEDKGALIISLNTRGGRRPPGRSDSRRPQLLAS